MRIEVPHLVWSRASHLWSLYAPHAHVSLVQNSPSLVTISCHQAPPTLQTIVGFCSTATALVTLRNQPPCAHPVNLLHDPCRQIICSLAAPWPLQSPSSLLLASLLTLAMSSLDIKSEQHLLPNMGCVHLRVFAALPRGVNGLGWAGLEVILYPNLKFKSPT